jgi:hypothetical protein
MCVIRNATLRRAIMTLETVRWGQRHRRPILPLPVLSLLANHRVFQQQPIVHLRACPPGLATESVKCSARTQTATMTMAIARHRRTGVRLAATHPSEETASATRRVTQRHATMTEGTVNRPKIRSRYTFVPFSALAAACSHGLPARRSTDVLPFRLPNRLC